LLEYDDVLNQQRTVIYKYRRSVLEGQDQIEDLVRDFIASSVEDMLAVHAPERTITPEQVDTILTMVSGITGLSKEDLKRERIGTSNVEEFSRDLINVMGMKYDLFRAQQPVEIIQNAEKWMMLETIDQAWKQHMLNLDHLKEGISLRSWGQKNPLIEYKREAFYMFQDMMRQIRWDVVHHLFHLNLQHFDARALERKREDELEKLNLVGGDASTEQGQAVRDEDKVGRNEPCGCGSGKKFKKCHGA
jgi:preprotein translocase subunit SecA